MTKFYLITIGIFTLIIVLLVLAIMIQTKVYKSRIRKTKERIINEQNERTKKTEEIINNASKKKADMRGGDDASSFNASLDVLRKHTSS